MRTTLKGRTTKNQNETLKSEDFKTKVIILDPGYNIGVSVKLKSFAGLPGTVISFTHCIPNLLSTLLRSQRS